MLVTVADTPENRLVIPRQCVDGRPVLTGSHPSNALIGDHDSDSGKDDCGAEKRLPDILNLIAKNSDTLRHIALSEGYVIDDETHNSITQKAQNLLDEGYPSSAFELRDAFTEVAGESCVSCLAGGHYEVVAKKNHDPTKTLDRTLVASEFGTSMEAFNFDVGVFPAAAAIISLTEREAEQKVAAMRYPNDATALILAHPSMLYIP